MQLTVLGSGSRGNAVLIESGEDAVLVDAGFAPRELVTRAAAAGRDLGRVRAVLLTHEHGDHARGAARCAEVWKVPVAASRGTLDALGMSEGTGLSLPAARSVRIASFRVAAFPTAHDAAEPMMLTVEDGDGLRVGIAYDVGKPTSAVMHACRGLDAIVVETNHDEVMLRASSYPPSVRARIAGSGGHLSNAAAADLLWRVAHEGLRLVVLAHLSDRCNRPDLALAAVTTALRGSRFGGDVVIAGQEGPTSVLDVGGAGPQYSLGLRRPA